MSITALPHPRTIDLVPPTNLVRPSTPRRRALRRRKPADLPTSADPQTLTLTFEVTLTGEERFLDAAEVLQTLSRVTERLAGATTRVRPALPALVAASVDGSIDSPAVDESTPDESSTVLIMTDSREVRVDGRLVPFTRLEFDLLHFLAAHPRQVFSRDQLLSRVWGFSHGGTRTVDVHIRRLRAKLPDRPLVVTLRGVGYRLADEASVRVV
jgi:DNA-binding response OmpR family regulator